MTQHTALPERYRIYVDLEYCYPGMTRKSGRPTDKDVRQVVQIAAIKFDTVTRRECATFDVLVKPLYTKTLPEFFVELTGITQQQVDADGLEFPAALSQFIAFCGEVPIFTFDKDWEVLAQNCGYYDLPFVYAAAPFTRVKALLPQWGVDPNAYSSGTLYQAAGLKMDGHVHNALHDVRSMAAAVACLEH